jgi:hypothetical protein
MVLGLILAIMTIDASSAQYANLRPRGAVFLGEFRKADFGDEGRSLARRKWILLIDHAWGSSDPPIR